MIAQRYIFIRHGQTDENLKAAFHGQTETPLNETGRAQVLGIREKLKEFEPYIVFASPQQRCKDTAEIVLGGIDSVIFSDKLKEINFGIFEGMTFLEVEEKLPEDIKKWHEDYEGYTIPNGEGVMDIYNRVSEFIKEVEDEYPGCNYLFVTHWGVIGAAFSYLLHKSCYGIWNYEFKNASINVIEKKKDHFMLKEFNIVGDCK